VKPVHVALAGLVAVVWGIAFVATKIGLESFSPPQLAALRFVIAALPVVLVPRPPVGWSVLIPVGLTLFAGQFLFQFLGIARGMPAGLAAIVVQMQAFFTICFAAVALGERPSHRQLAGMALALVGLAAIAATVGHDLTMAGLSLTLVSAVSWGIGNVLLKRLAGIDMLSLVIWLSLVPPLPCLALSMLEDGPASLATAVVKASWLSLGAALYLGLVATVFAYAIWGDLLRRYSAASVAPFALLVPFVAAYASSLVLGETFGGPRLAGMALVLAGIAVIVLPVERLRPGRGTREPESAPVLSPATSADAPGVIALISRVFAEYGFIYQPVTEVPDLLSFAEHYAPPHGAFFVVRQGDRIVGSVGVEHVDGRTAELHRLYVDATVRRQGMGQALVEAVLDWCRTQRIARLMLWSDTRFDRSHRLYARMGFRQGRERVVPGDVNHSREYYFERPVESPGPEPLSRA
jgi:O-acetylserine/cysteine efflux transporter